jgi:hypothetical protein
MTESDGGGVVYIRLLLVGRSSAFIAPSLLCGCNFIFVLCSLSLASPQLLFYIIFLFTGL